MYEVTTIPVHPETKQKLVALKDHPRETYDELLNELIEIRRAIRVDDEGHVNEETLKAIRRGREAYRKGQGISTRELLRRLGE